MNFQIKLILYYTVFQWRCNKIFNLSVCFFSKFRLKFYNYNYYFELKFVI